MKRQPPVHEHLWERLDWYVDRSAGWLGCWPWTGNRDGDGYGRVRWDTNRHRAHRLAYAVAYGPIPDGLVVCHSCDNPPCCNPAHLWVGTSDQNNQDRTRKGRELFGTRNPAAKLDAARVLALRVKHRDGLLGTAEAEAALLGVSPSLIRAVIYRKIWIGIEP